jgi:hypothetical protein
MASIEDNNDKRKSAKRKAENTPPKGTANQDLFEFYDAMGDDFAAIIETKEYDLEMDTMNSMRVSLDQLHVKIDKSIAKQTEVENEINEKHEILERLDLLAEAVSGGTYEVTQTKSDQGSPEQQVQLLTSVVMRQGKIIQSLQSDLLNCKYRQMRQNILVHRSSEGPYDKFGDTLNTIMSKDLHISTNQDKINSGQIMKLSSVHHANPVSNSLLSLETAITTSSTLFRSYYSLMSYDNSSSNFK